MLGILVRVLCAWAVLFGISRQSVAAETAALEMIAATGVKGGLIVHLGCGDGKLTAALHASDSFLVQGLDADAGRVEAARKYIQSRGLYGKVCVDRLSGKRLPYIDNAVNLLVCEDLGQIPIAEVLRVLAPGGAAVVKREGQWTKQVKPRPAEIDEWTHWLHDASGNAVARDRTVGPPERLQWAAGPVWARHHNTAPSLSAAVSAGGRLFYICDEAPPGFDDTLPDRYELSARDAFNGTLLWRTAIDDWGWRSWSATVYTNFFLGRNLHPTQIQRRLVAIDDRVYVTLGFNAPVSELDAATGKTLRSFPGTEHTSEILYYRGKLVLAIGKEPEHPGYVAKDPPGKKEIALLDVASGRQLWRAGDFVGISARSSPVQRITQLTMAVGPEGVFFVEEDQLVGLDLASGKPLWRVARPVRPKEKVVDKYLNDHTNLCTLVYAEGLLLFGQPHPQADAPPRNSPQPADLMAVSARDGQVKWRQPCGSWGYGTPIDIFVAQGLVWVHDRERYELLGLDPADGQVKKRLATQDVFDEAHHHRCVRDKATERFLVSSRRGVELTGWEDGTVQLNGWVRGECGFGTIPCNGLIYSTPHPCQCRIEDKLNGLFALAPEEAAKERDAEATEDRLERGPAFALSSDSQSPIPNPSDWPTYRHDPMRSSAAPASVAALVVPLWEASVGRSLSAPVLAEGKVFVAVVEEHRICALDAAAGRPLWSFTAGGPVDTPPSIYQGLALFGSRDGYVYCLRASDGQLVWRLRAAPRDRRLVANEQIESVWPVHGSILVVGDVAYCAAGRSSHLDGGIRLLAMRPATGQVLREETVASGGAAGQGRGKGALDDVLVFDGQSVCMRQSRFDLFGPSAKTGTSQLPPRHLLATGGLLDDTWFNRIYWALNGEPLGQLLVFDQQASYGIRAYDHPGNVSGQFTPGRKGYQLFAHPHAPAAENKRGKTAKRSRATDDLWVTMVPVRVRAMALAADTLFAAGTPDVVAPADPWAAVEGRQGGLLCAYSTKDGKKLAEQRLPAAPIYDGLAASGSRLYLSTADGKVRCLGSR
jgi:outer membrane protein assembly factor BamB